MNKHKKRGFSLVEVIVSIGLLAIVLYGFTVTITSNTAVLARGYRIVRAGYINAAAIEERSGTQTGGYGTLLFYNDEDELIGEITLYEYEVRSGKDKEKESFSMYYFEYR